MGNMLTIGKTTIPLKGDTDDVSDGYHTFGELYQFRMLYNAAFANLCEREGMAAECVKSWRHSDGELCFGKENYFVVVMRLPTGQISNHYKGEYWSLFDIPEVERAPEYDGHTPQDAAQRLLDWLQGKTTTTTETKPEDKADEPAS